MDRCDDCGFSYDEGLAWSAGTAIVDEPAPSAEMDGYADQDPVSVARQSNDAAELFENVLDRLGDDRRTCSSHPRRQGLDLGARPSLSGVRVRHRHGRSAPRRGRAGGLTDRNR